MLRYSARLRRSRSWIPATLFPLRAVDPDAHARRDDRHDPAADAALGRYADTDGKLAGAVVHAAGREDGVDVARQLCREDLAAGIREPSAVGEHCSDVRQRAAVHADGAGAEIAVENLLHIVVQQSIGLEQIGQRAVFAAVALFGVIDILVNSDALVSGQKPRQLQQALEAPP